MKIVVLGGTGLTGRCAVRDLAESREVSEVVMTGRSVNKAQKLADKIRSDKVSIAQIDVTKHDDTVKVLKDADVALNAIQYYYNMDVMKAALEAKVHYLDLGGLFHTVLKQLKLNGKFREAGLTAILGMGECPGITNVMARYAANRLDSVDTILVRDTWMDFTEGAPPFIVTWSLSTLFDEMTIPAVIFENGQYKEVPPLSGKETMTFPEPFGSQDQYYTIHSEAATFPVSFKKKGIKNVNWKEGGPGFLDLKMLVDAGLASEEPLRVKGTEISPRQFLLRLLDSKNLMGCPEGITPNDTEVTRIIAIGKKDGRKVSYTMDSIFRSKAEWEATAGEVAVGVPASIAAQMLARGDIQVKGTIPPENCFDPEPFMTELAKRDIKILETSKKNM
ncbi:MAG: saccharopine dehydrogenase NADP-binding domain-containing protein [Candidatus Bathyarchaeota archaeon]|jgi:saccharopine dehydrogenase-like NADP-dependent oxidoreductase|nr:MAG: saccharopine dehydrogenase NADP-binding domain-containing protein [Candidatus Bathyarchaeota archaeon]